MQHALYLAYTGQQLDTRGLFVWAQPELSVVIRSNGKLKLPCREMGGSEKGLSRILCEMCIWKEEGACGAPEGDRGVEAHSIQGQGMAAAGL